MTLGKASMQNDRARCIGVYHNHKRTQEASSHPAKAKGEMRAQISSIDLVLALIVFSLLFVFFVSSWSSTVSSAKNAMKKNRMEYAALSATDLMLKSPGKPANWEQNPASVQMVGLASTPNVLSQAKLGNFTAMNYSAQKSLLGMQEEFYFYIDNAAGTRLFEDGNLTVKSKGIVSITRYGILNGNKVKIGMMVYG